MRMRVPGSWAAAAMAGLLLASCGGSNATPTPDQLAAALLTADDLGGEWQVELIGPITDEMRAELGYIDMCPEAESIVAPISAGRPSTGDWQADWAAAVHALDWQLAVLTLPSGREDAEPASVFQGIATGDPDEIETIYRGLTEGYRRCLSVPPSDPDGPPIHEGAELALPTVGSERFGWALSMGDADNRWDIRWILVRDGAVLLVIEENEIISGDNVLSEQQVADLVATAAAKLP